MKIAPDAVIVTISGRTAAGKSTAARVFEASGGWRRLRGDRCALELRDCDRPEPSGGAETTSKGPARALVIEGCSLDTVIALKRRFGQRCISVHIETPREIRMLRRLGWSERDAEFHAADEMSGPAIDRLGGIADHCLWNGGSVADLARQIAPLLRHGAGRGATAQSEEVPIANARASSVGSRR